jgi:TM2 domain-containing membrane protein YozV
MYCSRCGSPNAESAGFCEKCGTSLKAPGSSPAQPGPPPPPTWQTSQPDPRIRGGAPAPAPVYPGKTLATGKNPVVALLLSLFIPGVGQFYNGDAKKGGIMLGAYVVSVILWAVYIGVLASLGIWIWSMVDAHSVASGKSPIW